MKTGLSRQQGMSYREKHLASARRVVIKVGSAVLTSENGLNHDVMHNLAKGIHYLRDQGREVILVSSGAVAAGRKKLGLKNRPIGLREKQAAAAAGQSSLMRAYEDIFQGLGIKVAQVLLTHDDLSHRDRYLNVRNTLFTLLDWGLVPIINENDTVSVEELRFGDNDTLGAMVTNMTEADMFVCLTDVAGLFTGNPQTDSEAKQVYTVVKVDQEIQGMAGNVASALGTGGMLSKIMAAKTVSARGGSSFIGPGTQKDIIRLLFSGEPVGTFFLPQKEKMHSRKHWIAYTLRPKGSLVLDPGACRAIIAGGKSLLPSGIIEVRGTFGVGAPVHCLDSNNNPIATGLVNYKSTDIEKIQGVQTSQIENRLGYKDSDEVIHRDNLVIL
ncbi:MAG: glutamate 5-kinase [Proteobacteria bacterium]|nr:glutamate 5-kinase [Pseudomonadota bacterium]MBU1710984.1 glutamate 5-kinase [Pseudomonadota bacterium]